MKVRFLVILVLGSLTFTALVAVAVLIFGEFDETAARVLGTSASVAGYSLLAMAGAIAFRRESPAGLRVAGGVGLVCTLVGFVIVLLMIWVKDLQDVNLAKTGGIAAVTAVALALVVLLARIPLPRSQRWLYASTVILILVLTFMIDVPVIALEYESDSLGRTMGVISVLAALGILSLPIVAWQAARERRTAGAPPPPGTLHLVCPGCGRPLDIPEGPLPLSGLFPGHRDSPVSVGHADFSGAASRPEGFESRGCGGGTCLWVKCPVFYPYV